jgi:hypothetical protein
MGQRAFSFSIGRRTALAAGVAVLVGVGAIAPAAAHQSAQQQTRVAAKPAPTIDTYIDWTDGYAAAFSRPETPTYGQVITVPADETDLVRFRFYLSHFSGTGHLVLRGEVYAWNGTMATGQALWEGVPRRIAYALTDTDYHRVGFHVGGLALAAGAQYVLFGSISKDYEQATPGYQLKWASVPDDSYRPGTFVYLSDLGDESRWTSDSWVTDYGPDLAFKAWLRPDAGPR